MLATRKGEGKGEKRRLRVAVKGVACLLALCALLCGFFTGCKTTPVEELVDFIVDVEEGRDPIVLHLTDPQIIDVAQARRDDRVSEEQKEYWATDKLEERCYSYIRETVETVHPDLILITGDIVYGEFDDAGTALESFVAFMDGFGIPWAPVFGNHDQESAKGADWQCRQFEQAEHCLFKQRTLSGNGNYTVGIRQGGSMKRVFFMLDSNGCTAASSQSKANGHTKTSAGFGDDQIQWYTDTAKQIRKSSPDTKLTFAFHIQQQIFADVFAKYDFTGVAVDIDRTEGKQDGDFGIIGLGLKSPWDGDYSVWKGMKALGIDSVFVGHEHCNSCSIVYDGIRFQYGQKSSTYDRENWVDAGGKILSIYPPVDATPLIGGTVVPLSEKDGSIKNPYIYLCKDAGGSLDWDHLKDVKVSGLQRGSDLIKDSSINMLGVEFDADGNAYEVTAKSQGKIYVDTSRLKGKTAFTFEVYVPQGSPVLEDPDGEFALHIHPETLFVPYLRFSSAYSESDAATGQYALTTDTWMTYTIDISAYSDTCSEFALLFPENCKVYIRNLTLS